MNKRSGRLYTYPTLTDLVERNGSERLGISRASLYNALHMHNGKWENGRWKVYYETVDLGKTIWT